MGIDSYDAVVIGTGQGGKPLAAALAGAGWRTAIIERHHVGGTCVNVGCTPTKTMLASARVAYLARRAGDYGVEVGGVEVDLEKVRQRKRQIVQDFRQSSTRGIERVEGLDLIRGEARFSAPHSLTVRLEGDGERSLRAERIFLNTGARPRRPAVPGLDGVAALDSTSIMELDRVPEHLLVLGGGYIGLEFGQMFRRFGSQVTIVQRSGQLLPREDPDIAREVCKILQEDGIRVLLETEASGTSGAGNVINLTVQRSDGEEVLSGTHLLVAAGRVPNSEDLNLEAAGIERDDRGFVRVNGRLETSVDGVWALGDVKGDPAFTHISYDDYRILRTNLLQGGDASTESRLVPYTVFIDPELGRVGMSERQARSQGHRIKVGTMPMSHVARALEADETRGLMKVVVDAERDRILGCAILGTHGGEVMSMLQLAMMGELPYTALRDGIFAHPTLAESLNNLFASLES